MTAASGAPPTRLIQRPPSPTRWLWEQPPLPSIRLASNTVGGVTTILAATGEAPATTPAAPGNGSNCGAPGWVRRSTDGGVTFGLGLIQTSGFCNGQCFYDMSP